MDDLFDFSADQATRGERPLAEKMRPESLSEMVGQAHILGKGALIPSAIAEDRMFSMIFWGPPGCGKTTLARIIARETRMWFVQISAVLSGVKQVREVIEEARNQKLMQRRRTLLFVDEIHRFNKAQQDAFLQHVEDGLITLIGATTENPSFEVIPALLSRCRVFTLHPAAVEDLVVVLGRALTDEKRGLGRLHLTAEEEALTLLAGMADGDFRAALGGLEMAAFHRMAAAGPEGERRILREDVAAVFQQRNLRFDKSGDQHFDTISAFHKSMRGSDPDGALYWMFRMLAAGEDPLYVARRMVRFASEDVGMADPGALSVALHAMEAYRFLGSPEGEGALAQAAAYLATAPKSNSVYMAQKQIMERIGETGALPVPMHIRNAPTKLMAELGYNKGYKYAHDYEGGYVAQEYLPEPLRSDRYYRPTDRGYEQVVNQRMAAWEQVKAKKQDPAS